MSESILPLSLRPKTLDALIGQKRMVTGLRARMEKRPPRTILLSGSPGTGKTTAARIIAMSFQCPHQTVWGNPCDACWARWGEFAIHEVDASNSNGIDEMRQMVEMSRFDPMPPSLKRVMILDEAQKTTAAAQNALLKPTEDVPANMVWIIASSEPNKLIAALQRRFTCYALEGLNQERIQILLQRAAKKVSYAGKVGPLTIALEKADINSPALVLMAFEHYVSGHSPEEAAAAVRNAGAGNADTLAICKAVSTGRWADVLVQLGKATPEESRWIRGSLAGWLRSWLLKERNPTKADKVSACLLLLLGPAPLEDAALFPWLVAVLYKIARTLGGISG